MRVGILRVYLNIPHAQSLKQKRQGLRSLKDRLRNTFNVSVAETGANDKWQVGELGIATVANDTRFVNSVMEKVRNYVSSNPAVRIIEADLEIL